MVMKDRNDAVNGISGPLREFLAKLVELKQHDGASCRVLEKLIPYSKSSIHDKLVGKSSLDWEFVADFVSACAKIAGRDPDLSMWKAEFDRVSSALDLARYRLRYLDGEEAVGSPLYTSWERSGRRAHIAARFLGEPSLDTPLIKYGQVVVDDLIDCWSGPPVAIVLATPKAVVCSRRSTDRDLERRLDRNYLAPGFCYAEEHIATNGIGAALATRKSAYVLGAGHLAEELQDDACAATVISDPGTHEVAGIVNLTCRLRDRNPLLVTVAKMAAAAIGGLLIEDRRGYAR